MKQVKNFPAITLHCLLALTLVLPAPGCVRYKPATFSDPSFMTRAQTQSDGKVRITLAVLSDNEGKKFFGVPLAKRRIQAVWIHIENKDTIPYFFTERNVDPNYFSYSEAAYRCHYKQGRRILGLGLMAIVCFPILVTLPVTYFSARIANKQMDKIFSEHAMQHTIIEPGVSESGFVFTTLDEGTKLVHVCLMGNQGIKKFTFTVPVPGIKADFTLKEFSDRYPETTIKECTDEELFKALSDLPHCTTGKRGLRNGDPINIALIGELDDLLAVLAMLKWDETECLTTKSGLAMAKALFTGANYRYSPISPLYVYGHSQDIAFQKIHGSIKERLHMRLWYSPLRYNSKPVWIGTISRDIGVRMTWRTWYLTTHKIDEDIDDSRDYLLSELAEKGKLSRYGFIRLGDPVPESKPRRNLTGDPYFTDNLRAVMEISPEHTLYQPFNWDSPVQSTKSN